MQRVEEPSEGSSLLLTKKVWENSVGLAGLNWECKLPFRLATKNSFLCKPDSVGHVVKFTASSFLGGHSSLSKVDHGVIMIDTHINNSSTNGCSKKIKHSGCQEYSLHCYVLPVGYSASCVSGGVY